MLKFYAWLTARLASERGQDMVEYALATAVLAVAVVMATLWLLSPAFAAWASSLAGCVSRPSAFNCVP